MHRRIHHTNCLVLMLALSLPSATAAAIAIDEVLADPPSGTTGDANQDGTRKTYEDEFIELYNSGPDTVSLAGWRLGDDDIAYASLFAFPDSTLLPPNSRLLLFGGGMPTGFAVPAFADDGRIGNGLSNGGDTVILFNSTGDTVDVVALATWPKDQSVVRVPTGSGAFVAHKTASPSDSPFSPGRALADSAAQTATPAPPTVSTTDTSQTTTTSASTDPNPEPTPTRPQPQYPIFISEILADPPSGIIGDANRDGQRDTYQDEFIELYNAGSAPISLAGWRLMDDDIKTDAAFRFPDGALLAPGSYVVLFGGGHPTDFTIPVFADDGRIGNGLTNSGDRLLLLDAAADTVLDVIFTSASSIDQSLIRDNDRYRRHNQLPGRGLFSPGQAQTEYTSFAITDPELTEGQTAKLVLVGHHPTGSDTLDATSFKWLSVDPHIAEIRPAAKVKGLRPGRTRLECWLKPLFIAQRQIRIRPLEPHNDPPRILSTPDTTAFAGGRYRYPVRATDPEHNTLVFTLAQAPPWLDLDYQSGLMQGRAPDTTGIFTIAFEAADGRGGLAAQSYRLHLLPRPQVRIDEVLSDPPLGARGDANQDGHRHTYEDEFVELYNAGQTPADLGGCSLSDGDGKAFAFPALTILAPGGRAVVFGGGTPSGPFTFSAGGRIGDGLGNRRDELYLIGPRGLDTLAHLTYDLRRDPDQSLVDHGQILHAAWPGRDPFSPGMPRPLLQSLRPPQHKLNLVQGEKRQLRLLGHYSDGGEYPVATTAAWTSSNPAVAAITANGALSAIDTGTCQLSVHLDSFAIYPDTLIVQIRLPLAAALRYTPTWEDSLPRTIPQPFIVRSNHPEKHTYIWSLNSQRLPIMAPQYLHPPSVLQIDTIRVEVRRGLETSTRQWILHPVPTAKLVSTRHNPLLQAWPNPFNYTSNLHFQQTTAGPTHLALYNLQGQRVRTLVDAIFNAGSHQIAWDGLDQRGRSVATGLYLARLITPTMQTHSKLLLLR